MKTLRILAFLSFALLPALRAQQPPPGFPAAPTPPIATGGEIAATTAAEVWLALADDGQYEKCWDTGAKILQGIVTKTDWTELAKSHRPPLGKVVSRKLTDSSASKTLPGAPEGQYVTLQFATEFEHKKPAKETVTVALDPSGQWKVSGYYIR